MLFLIHYDREAGRIIELRKFDDSQKQAAEEARIDLELLVVNRRLDQEIVILQASSEEAVRRTHRRYFESVRAIANDAEAGGDDA